MQFGVGCAPRLRAFQLVPVSACLLPAFLLVYWAAPRQAKNGVAIAASLVFYAWGAPRFLPVVLALGFIDFGLSHWIARLRTERSRGAKWLLAVGVTMHVAVLAYFKYSNFFVGQLHELFGLQIQWTQVVLPIGISFITFEEITYLTDVYRGDAKPARRLSHYMLFLTLFPHSIAGPIFRWKDLEAQLAERTHSWQLAREGFERFARGLGKKVLLADSVALIADGTFGLHSDQLTPGLAWLGATAYAIQIYFDFSGYSDMAIGLGKMIGFRFKENFNQPYISSSLTEFWTRWHISLSNWMRDYLYIPLGGNRRGRTRAMVNLVLVFTISGFWHGAAWTFILWGLFHGTFVMIERLVGARREALPAVVQHALTLLLVLVSWVLFRATSATHAGDFIATMFGLHAPTAPVSFLRGDFMPLYAMTALVIGVAISLVPIASKYVDVSRVIARVPQGFAHAGYFLMFALSAMHLTNMRITPLIYFKF
jgi:alginate O-acetyltransferase complex protein AlgI